METAKRPNDGWTYPGVLVLVTIFTIVGMGIDAVVNKKIGVISEISLGVIALTAAIKVRPRDYMAAVWSPAISWVLALATVGQFALPSGSHIVRREILHFAYGLAYHAIPLGITVLLSSSVAIVRHFRYR